MCAGGCSIDIYRGIIWETPLAMQRVICEATNEPFMYACFRGCRKGRKAVELIATKYEYNGITSPVMMGSCSKCEACSLHCCFCGAFVKVVESKNVHKSVLRHLIKHIGFGESMLYNGVINGEKRSEFIGDVSEIIPQLLFLLPGIPYDTKNVIIPDCINKESLDTSGDTLLCKESFDFVKLAHNSSYSCLWCGNEFDCLPDKIMFEAHMGLHFAM